MRDLYPSELERATLSYEAATRRWADGRSGLHGMSSSRASEDQGGFFDWSALKASGRRIVRYDARGHGRSTRA